MVNAQTAHAALQHSAAAAQAQCKASGRLEVLYQLPMSRYVLLVHF